MIAAQHGLSVILVEQMGPGGQVMNVDRIENMPGFPDGISGYELGPLIQTQAEAAGCDFAFDSVVGLEIDGDRRVVRCDGEDLEGRSVIIAAGSRLRDGGLAGGERFVGKGVSHCASCDGPFFAGKTVAVVGGGDSAIEEAAVLSQFASKVRVFSREPDLHAQHYLLKAARDLHNVEILHNTEVVGIKGDDVVNGVDLRDVASGETREESIDGVFVYAGLEPNTAFLREVLELDPMGHVVTDIHLATSCPGVFAAGDIRQHSVSLIASAIGDGATAAVNAYRYVRSHAPVTP